MFLLLFLPNLKKQLPLPLRQADLEAAWQKLLALYLFSQNAPSSRMVYKIVR